MRNSGYYLVEFIGASKPVVAYYNCINGKIYLQHIGKAYLLKDVYRISNKPITHIC